MYNIFVYSFLFFFFRKLNIIVYIYFGPNFLSLFLFTDLVKCSKESNDRSKTSQHP
jgi:hypothetical protein